MSSLGDLLDLLQAQQAFVKAHAGRVRRECNRCASKDVTWELFGMRLGADEALAAVEASPELLAKLDFRKRRAEGTSTWDKFSSFFTSLSTADAGGAGVDVEQELGTLLSAREVGQVYGHVATAVAKTLETMPTPGSPTSFELAVQLPLDGRCPGSGSDGAVFLTVGLDFEAQNGLQDQRDTLSIDTRLYAHTDGYLGGQVDALVDVSGAGALDEELPAVDVVPTEVKATLAKDGVYLASTSLTFIVEPRRPIAPERVGVVSHAVTKKLVERANRQIREYYNRRKAARAERRKGSDSTLDIT